MSNKEFKTVSYKTNRNNNNTNTRDNQLKNLERRINSPKVDLIERNQYYLVRIELPGVTSESIKIQIKEHQIVFVSGFKLQEPISENDRVIYRECKYNNFVRRIKLPGPIKFFNINEKLNFSNGVLHLTFEKVSSPVENNDVHDISLDLNEIVDWSEV